MADMIERPERADRRVGLLRLAVGLAQGLTLYGLHRAGELKVWPATDAPLFAASSLAVAFAPLVVLAGLGHLRRSTLAVWFVAAAAVCAIFAGYRAMTAATGTDDGFPNFPSGLAAAAFLFIAHHLIVPADADRTWVAPYRAYFDRAWLDSVQLGLAIAFTGAFWLVLGLGAALFALIGIKQFGTFIGHDWFYFPATAVMFATGVHLADIRVGLTRGLRTVALILLSWLLPLMSVIAVAFVVALPFTGLAALWRSGASTGVLLSAMAVLILLINAAYQDGDHPAPGVQKWAARATALALAGLAGVAAYGIALRIGEHGLTPQRILAGACALVAGGYAAGYAYAAVRPGRWMRRLEATNIAAAPLILVIVFALFTPLADPARLSVDDQVARLERGRTKVADFDFRFLRFDAGGYGLTALRRLAVQTTGPRAAAIRMAAGEALKRDNRYAAEPVTGAARLATYPQGVVVPPELIAQLENGDRQACLTEACDAYVLDLDGDGLSDVVIKGPYQMSVYARIDPNGLWIKRGTLTGLSCGDTLAALRAGKAVPTAPQWKGRDLVAGGERLVFDPWVQSTACPTKTEPHPNTPSPGPPPSAVR